MDMVFLVLKDTFVGTCQFCLLRDLYQIGFTFLKTLAHSVGKRPLVVSPDVIVASVRSSTALMISATSALVGLGLFYMDSTI